MENSKRNVVGTIVVSVVIGLVLIKYWFSGSFYLAFSFYSSYLKKVNVHVAEHSPNESDTQSLEELFIQEPSLSSKHQKLLNGFTFYLSPISMLIDSPFTAALYPYVAILTCSFLLTGLLRKDLQGWSVPTGAWLFSFLYIWNIASLVRTLCRVGFKCPLSNLVAIFFWFVFYLAFAVLSSIPSTARLLIYPFSEDVKGDDDEREGADAIPSKTAPLSV